MTEKFFSITTVHNSLTGHAVAINGIVVNNLDTGTNNSC